MDMLIWNCRGALKSTFCYNVFELVHTHSPAIMILIETKACGDRAKRIIDRLPFDVAIIANKIGLSGGLWVLWDSSQVAVVELSSIEQEIHAVVTTTKTVHGYSLQYTLLRGLPRGASFGKICHW
ncbi:hypothetical protein SO802_028618 [Lithocarpus litseifolius]|uniref:Endonuclease/exonuclease/phosphatase domain-containing protein n=1 Tax=Lithocarpus litseifolius TaxID=425828 RepID=A0AAW2BTY1_9ROSI